MVTSLASLLGLSPCPPCPGSQRRLSSRPGLGAEVWGQDTGHWRHSRTGKSIRNPTQNRPSACRADKRGRRGEEKAAFYLLGDDLKDFPRTLDEFDDWYEAFMLVKKAKTPKYLLLKYKKAVHQFVELVWKKLFPDFRIYCRDPILHVFCIQS